MPKIEQIFAREILDSRGQPTVEVDLWLSSGHFGCGAVPSGTSSGSHEAIDLRDKDPKRFQGQGVLQAVQNVNQEIKKSITNRDWNQIDLDDFLKDLDGTPSKQRLGANAILGVSLAFAQAAAQEIGVPLYKYFQDLAKIDNELKMPTPMVLVLEGGKHAIQSSDFQEFMIVPKNFNDFSESLRVSTEIYHKIEEILSEYGLSTHVGLEGAFAPTVGGNQEFLEMIMQGIRRAGYRPGEEIGIAVDSAASTFYEDGKYQLRAENNSFSASDLVTYYENWITRYPLVSLEDGLAEDDWDGWKELNQRLGGRIQIVGDDLFVTNSERLAKGVTEDAANAILIKPNQIGTLTETIETVRLAVANGYKAIVSHRSGETDDTTIADLVVGLGLGQCKFGAPCRGERVAKYNRLLRISEEIE